MKIAFPSDDGATISRHFGRASQYVVVWVEDGRPAAREVRDKAGQQGQPGAGPTPAQPDPRHDSLIAPIADCQLVISGGMGFAMDKRLRAAGLRAIRTPMSEIDQALEAFLAGRLEDNIDLIF